MKLSLKELLGITAFVAVLIATGAASIRLAPNKGRETIERWAEHEKRLREHWQLRFESDAAVEEMMFWSRLNELD